MTKFVCFGSVLCAAILATACQGNNSDGTKLGETENLSWVDFETTEQSKWVSAERNSAAVTDIEGGKALSLTLSHQSNRDSIFITPETPWDLSGFSDHNLAMDVKNLSGMSTQLYVVLEDPEGNQESRSVSLPAQYDGTIFIPLTGSEARLEAGLWGIPKVWPTDDLQMVWRSKRKNQINPNKIAQIEFLGIGLLEDRRLTVDNIRLRENPKRTEDWLVGLVDEFGQNARVENALTVSSVDELRDIARMELAELANSPGMADRSRFGGYKDGPKLEATGFFRSQKVDGKWWMVDPEGYLFFSVGPANVRMANMSTITGIDFRNDTVRNVSADEVTPEDSLGIIPVSAQVRESRYVTSKIRNEMFEWLPEYDDELADHYSYRRSTHVGPVEHGETYSFYRANLERRYGETSPGSYMKKWESVTLDRMNAWGFTSFGNWVDPAFYPNEQVPYFANGWIIGDFKTLNPSNTRWSPMPDFYDPIFAERADATIKVIAEEVKASPWCVGVFIDNEKSWGEREGSVEARYGVISEALAKSTAESPAKTAFTKHLKEKYGTIDALNTAWATEIVSWVQFEQGVVFDNHTAAHVSDLSEMLKMLGEQYFKVVTSTLDKYLPDHLYMGARMANWGMPDEIIEVSVKYSDVLSFNIYEDGVQPHHWDFLKAVDLPVVIGEFHIGTTGDSGMFNPGIVHAFDQADRARAYTTYMQSVLDHPNFVGAHWFQYMDEPITGRAYDGENANIGFVNVADIPYPELVEAASRFNRDLYKKRYGK